MRQPRPLLQHQAPSSSWGVLFISSLSKAHFTDKEAESERGEGPDRCRVAQWRLVPDSDPHPAPQLLCGPVPTTVPSWALFRTQHGEGRFDDLT